MTEIFDEVCTSYDNCTWIGRDGVKRAIDRLKAAHESEIAELQRQYEQNVIELQRAHKREMETVLDPQRIGCTLERDSFEYALEQLREFRWQHATNDNDAIPYINGIAKAHEHEMEHLRKKCFREGYEAGQRSMDAEELRETLIETLEDKDGNDDNNNSYGCNRNHHCCDQRQVSYDELGNERRKAIAELREIQTDAGGFVRSLARAIGVEWQAQRAKQTITEVRDRLIHLLGGDQPTLSDLYGIWQDGEKSENRDSESARKMTKSAETINLGDESDSELMENGENHKFDGRITDELREYNNKQIKWLDMTKVHYRKLFDIADRIDEHVRQLERDVEMWRGRAEDMRMERDELREKCDRLKEKVEHQREQLAVYATMCDFDAIRALKRERNEHKHRADNAEGHVKSLERRLDAAHETYCALLNDAAREFRALTEERDELQSKLDDYDKAHVELPKDDSDEYIYIGDVMDGYGKTIEVVELRYERSGWVLISKDGNEYANTFAFEHHREPTVEQVIRDLTLGKITEAQAIERIEGING